MNSTAEIIPKLEMETLDWTDYTVFVAMLGFSTIIGIYFGFFAKKTKSTDEYLLGGKNMKPIPVGWSLVASSISGITFVGVPAEVYSTKGSFWLTSPSLIFACPISYYFFIKVLRELNITSTYEYLEMRFNRSIRIAASWFFNISFLFLLPITIYIPALTLNQVTGINLHLISFTVTAICVFYTMIGGMKAVVWTDFLQLSVMMIAFLAILVVGTVDAGGTWHVLKTAGNDGKLDIFDFDFNIFQRSTFVTIFFGAMVFQIVAMGTGQVYVQRYLALPTKKDIKIALLILVVGAILTLTFAVYSGILVYTAYYGCDPVSQKVVAQTDQIFPYYVLDKIGYIPTLPGLFVAGVFSAALSTLSTGLNTIAGTIYEDNLKKRGYSDNKAYLLMQLIIVVIGIFSVLMVFLIQHMGKIVGVVYIMTSVTSAPVYCLFVLGMCVPICNEKGAIAGGISCTLVLGWIAIGSMINRVNFATMNIYPEEANTCPLITSVNSTLNAASLTQEDDTFFLYKLSYMMYTTVGLFVGITVATITSYITGPTDPATIDPMLISPPLRRFLPKRKIVDLEMEDEKFQEDVLIEKI